MPAAATSISPSRPSPTSCASTGSRSSSIAPMAPPTRSRPRRCGSWAPSVVPLGVEPNGTNINDRLRLDPSRDCCSETVVASGADIGLALDGDADRLIVVDETGPGGRRRPADGADRARSRPPRRAARAAAVVATVMSNLGLERRLAERRLALNRTKVGDRYVLEEMRAVGLQRRRRAVGPHHPDRPCDHRRRAGRRAAGAGRAGRERQAGERAAPPVRAGAATAQERPLRRRRAARRRRRSRRRIAEAEARARRPRPAGHPQVGHRAADPGHGRRRRRRRGRAAGRRHLRRRWLLFRLFG